MTRAVDYFYDAVIGDTVTVIVMDMDPAVKGQIVFIVDEDRFAIYINALHSDETQHKAFDHELRHLHSKDFDKNSVQRIESIAHGIPEEPESPEQSEHMKELAKAFRKEGEKASKRLAAYYKRMEKRRKMLEEQGLYETTEIVDGPYGPRVKKVVKSYFGKDPWISFNKDTIYF